MAIVTINDTNLNDIANAIRNKNGKTTKYKPSEMAAAIAAITGGGGGGGNAETFTIEGDASMAFSGWTSISSSSASITGAKWELFKHALAQPGLVETKDITNMHSICRGLDMEELPVEINLAANKTKLDLGGSAFRGTKLRKLPKINWNGSTIDANGFLNYLCGSSYYLEDISTLDDIPGLSDDNTTWSGCSFSSCYSLRSIPAGFMAKLQEVDVLRYLYNATFSSCFALDELVGVPTIDISETTNMFTNTFGRCGRIKRLTFRTNEDGTPLSRTWWKKQTIDLASTAIDYLTSTDAGNMIKYSSTITEDKEVTDAATYEALKNDPDWFSTSVYYSRYNHDSAVETINSLPIVAAGGGNTIKFSGNLGRDTDGGAVNTLTEEEIAVATAKHWTVTLA